MSDQKKNEQANKKDDMSVDELREALLGGYVPTDEDVSYAAYTDESERELYDTTPDDDVVSDFLTMFGAEGHTPLKASDWVVYVPSELAEMRYQGAIYGFIRTDTESAYILSTHPGEVKGAQLIGFIQQGKNAFGIKEHGYFWRLVCKYDISGTLSAEIIKDDDDNIDNGGIEYFPTRIKYYDRVTNLFSRNTGILESSDMLDKCAVLVGLGSVGSFAAMELARSGVGKFVLCDTDILEIHNICRHQCGFEDVGRYKIDAVRDKILNINPDAQIVTYQLPIQRVPKADLAPYLGENTVIIGGGDNRASANDACKLACESGSSFVATSCWSRAFAGEVFYWYPKAGLSCYECALGGLIDDERPDAHSHYFGMDDDMETLSFEPGIAVDIDFVTLVATKVALDLLNRNNPNYTTRVIDYLRQYTWVCNTNKTNIGGERAGMFSYPLQVTNNLSVSKSDDCKWCSERDASEGCE